MSIASAIVWRPVAPQAGDDLLLPARRAGFGGGHVRVALDDAGRDNDGPA
ncbi:hypothetical protein [Luteimonas sp. 3794]|nr:hypothetical protein [Luteimonas sp. 3794]MDR6990356.1 hypothetical protein [Luteimonas sp. 3794]